MKDSDFAGLMQGLNEAVGFINGDENVGRVHIPAKINAALIREKSGLSQQAFADRIGISIGTLRNWEQGRRVPDGPARVLLALLAKNPRIVEETLAS
jgi:putative transcriptional regulator